MSDPRSDAELVEAANRGDSAALTTLYLRYRDWATSLAHRFTGDPELALDIMQDTFLYLFSKFPGFKLRAKLTTFLYPAIRNNSLAARRKKRPASDEDALGAFPAPPSTDTAQSRVDQSNLAAAISKLPNAQREVLLMRAVDEMSTCEIALALGIPEGTVKSRLHHAIAALKDLPALRACWEG